MDYKALKDYREAEREFIRGFGWAVLISIAFCFISRAPTLVDKATVEGMNLSLNVGYPVIFGPFLILALIIFHEWVSRHIAEQRSFLPEGIRGLLGVTKFGVPALCFFLLPALASFWLVWQSIMTITPRDVPCAEFSHLRMLWDFSLLGVEARYCFGQDGDAHNSFPWVYAPVVPWLGLAAASYSAVLGYKIWKALQT